MMQTFEDVYLVPELTDVLSAVFKLFKDNIFAQSEMIAEVDYSHTAAADFAYYLVYIVDY